MLDFFFMILMFLLHENQLIPANFFIYSLSIYTVYYYWCSNKKSNAEENSKTLHIKRKAAFTNYAVLS